MSSLRSPPAGVVVFTLRTSARAPFFTAFNALSNFSMSPVTCNAEKEKAKMDRVFACGEVVELQKYFEVLGSRLTYSFYFSASCKGSFAPLSRVGFRRS